MDTVRTLVGELVAAGLPPDQAAEIIARAMFTGSQMARPEQSKHAQAQQRYRVRELLKEVEASQVTEVITDDQHRDHCDHIPSPKVSPSLSPTPPITTPSSPPPSSLRSESGGRPATRPELDQKFEDFKRAYPKRTGANPWKPARALFDAAVKRGTNPDDITAALAAGIGFDPEKVGTEFIPQAVKWMRDRRWEDLTAVQPRKLTADEQYALDHPGWRPGLPTHEELLARYGRNRDGGDQKSNGEAVFQARAGPHREDAEGRSLDPPDLEPRIPGT